MNCLIKLAVRSGWGEPSGKAAGWLAVCWGLNLWVLSYLLNDAFASCTSEPTRGSTPPAGECTKDQHGGMPVIRPTVSQDLELAGTLVLVWSLGRWPAIPHGTQAWWHTPITQHRGGGRRISFVCLASLKPAWAAQDLAFKEKQKGKK